MVCFIYRPEYYGITEDEEGNPTTGTGEIIIAKHRNGSLENVQLKFTAHLAKFSNLESNDFGAIGQMPQSTAFDIPSKVVPSKMNEGDDFAPSNDEAPF
jgi:replicative DNA helicase